MWTALKIDELKSVKSMLDLSNKKALITGGSRGIGMASACALAELGADLVITGREKSKDKLRENKEYIEKKYGVNVLDVICEVSEEQSVKDLFRTIKEKYGTIDVVFSNAGYFSTTDVADQPKEDFMKLLEVDVAGTMLVCREAANLMIENKHGGSLIMNASMTAHIVNRRKDEERYNIAYPAAKGAVLQMVKGMALDYARWGIRVNSISPGYILSGLHDGRAVEYFEWTANNVPMKRYGTLDEIVGMVVYLASDLSSYTSGADMLVDGGYCAW